MVCQCVCALHVCVHVHCIHTTPTGIHTIGYSTEEICRLGQCNYIIFELCHNNLMIQPQSNALVEMLHNNSTSKIDFCLNNRFINAKVMQSNQRNAIKLDSLCIWFGNYQCLDLKHERIHATQFVYSLLADWSLINAIHTHKTMVVTLIGSNFQWIALLCNFHCYGNFSIQIRYAYSTHNISLSANYMIVRVFSVLMYLYIWNFLGNFELNFCQDENLYMIRNICPNTTDH